MCSSALKKSLICVSSYVRAGNYLRVNKQQASVMPPENIIVMIAFREHAKNLRQIAKKETWDKKFEKKNLLPSINSSDLFSALLDKNGIYQASSTYFDICSGFKIRFTRPQCNLHLKSRTRAVKKNLAIKIDFLPPHISRKIMNVCYRRCTIYCRFYLLFCETTSIIQNIQRLGIEWFFREVFFCSHHMYVQHEKR